MIFLLLLFSSTFAYVAPNMQHDTDKQSGRHRAIKIAREGLNNRQTEETDACKADAMITDKQTDTQTDTHVLSDRRTHTEIKIHVGSEKRDIS